MNRRPGGLSISRSPSTAPSSNHSPRTSSSRMTCGWRSLLALAMSAALPPAASAQQVRELGVQALVTTAEPTLVAGGIYGAVRPSRHTRVALTLAGGTAEGSLAGRAELVAHALAAPGRRRGAQVYAGAGIAGVAG